jgi:hypothetical protein
LRSSYGHFDPALTFVRDRQIWMDPIGEVVHRCENEYGRELPGLEKLIQAKDSFM